MKTNSEFYYRTSYFNLVDLDGESMGILETDLHLNTVNLEWSVYTNKGETSFYGVDEFIELLKNAYPEHSFKRFFFDAIIDPVGSNYLINKNQNKSKINLNSLQ